jgi:hypothetical protein
VSKISLRITHYVEMELVRAKLAAESYFWTDLGIGRCFYPDAAEEDADNKYYNCTWQNVLLTLRDG